MATVLELRQKQKLLNEVVLRTKGNIIYVDFVLISMVDAVEDWYKDYYQNDPWNLIRKAHTFHLIRFYDKSRFSNHETLGEERNKYLEEVDIYVQMRRDD
jgi:hypothetical protein